MDAGSPAGSTTGNPSSPAGSTTGNPSSPAGSTTGNPSSPAGSEENQEISDLPQRLLSLIPTAAGSLAVSPTDSITGNPASPAVSPTGSEENHEISDLPQRLIRLLPTAADFPAGSPASSPTGNPSSPAGSPTGSEENQEISDLPPRLIRLITTAANDTDPFAEAAIEGLFTKLKETDLKKPAVYSPSDAPELYESNSSECDQEPVSSFTSHHLPRPFLRRIEFMGGPDDFLLTREFDKRLSDSDVSRRRNRLRIPSGKISSALSLLTIEEEERARGQGMEVSILEPDASVGSMTLGRCRIRGKHSYVLTGDWRDLVERHRLRMGMELRLWSFRIRSKLWFALHVAEDPTRKNEEQGQAGTTSSTDQNQKE